MTTPLVSSAAAPETDVSTPEDAEQVFSQSILISATRCVLTYVIFPFVAPLVGLAAVGPWVGVVLSLVAIYFNVYSIRRFWAADHRWKKPMSVLNVGVIILVSILLVLDLQTILS
ncbi:MAG: hypothetical protein ACN4GZ_03775 [Acidimicrobiales bacterium]